jgi:hypothetical protein
MSDDFQDLYGSPRDNEGIDPGDNLHGAPDSGFRSSAYRSNPKSSGMPVYVGFVFILLIAAVLSYLGSRL